MTMLFSWAPEELEKFSKVWDETTLGESKKFPPGRYTVKVSNAQKKISKKDQKMVEWDLIIIGGEYDGDIIKRWNMLNEEKKAAYLKRDMLRCGINVGKFNDLEKDLNKLIGLELEIDLEDNFSGGTLYTNVNIVRKLEDLPF